MPRDGFTFIELLIVVLLLGVMAGVAAPRYQAAIAETHLTTATKQLAAHLRHGRTKATTTSSAVTFSFDLASSSYASDQLTMLDRPTENLLVKPASEGYPIRIDSADFGGDTHVTFDLYGNASSSGSVVLSLMGSQQTVLVNGAGGVTYP